MRRHTTWLLVAALVLLGLAATVDAMRGDRKPVPQAAPRNAAVLALARQPELAVSQLREAGVTGVLTYSDTECRLHAVSLPELEPVRAPSYEMCRPLSPSGGLRAVGGDVVWAALGYGTAQVVLSKEELTRALRPEGRFMPGGYRARQAVSLGKGRYAVLAHAPEASWDHLLLLFERTQLVARVAGLLAEDVVVRPSPARTYLGVFSPTSGGVRIYTRDGRAVPLPPIAEPQAVAWSPGELWTAVATDRSVHVFPSGRPDEQVVRIPLAVRDLDWGE